MVDRELVRRTVLGGDPLLRMKIASAGEGPQGHDWMMAINIDVLNMVKAGLAAAPEDVILKVYDACRVELASRGKKT